MYQPVFHLGICMAGAVSAGSYTAGTMSYLLQVLEKWEKAKKQPYASVPDYQVSIDVLTGASAGGITAAVTAAMLKEPVDTDDPFNNRIYKAWVELDDDERKTTIEKMLDVDDLHTSAEVRSLLNSGFIDRIADRTLEQIEAGKQVNHPYVSPHLDVLLTLSNLDGIPFGIEFQSYGQKKGHNMVLHADFAHFMLDKEPGQEDDFMRLDLSSPEDIVLLKEAAMATGAFPVGLISRKLKRKLAYVLNKARTTIGADTALGLKLIPENMIGDPLESLFVDGGMINNEPFGEAERLLDIRSGKKPAESLEASTTNRAVIMIDPFPSDDLESNRSFQGVTKLVPNILKAMRQQMMFRPEDVISALSDNNFTKFMLVPTKSGKEYPAACSALSGFGGFLHKDFRIHDYLLGRRNCQQFLRKVFVLPYFRNEPSRNNPIHREWHAEAVQRFAFTVDGQEYLPIIPDMDILSNSRGRFLSQEPRPADVAYDLAHLHKLEDSMKKRLRKIADVLIDEMTRNNKQAPEEKNPIVAARHKKGWLGTAWNGIKSGVFKQAIVPHIKSAVIEQAKNTVIDTVISDFYKRGVINKDTIYPK